MTESHVEERSTVAWLIATALKRRGVERVYGLVGGHIQPIWDAVARLGIDVIDVRHESAAVYMAHAEAELTGRLGVAMVTAGPGLTNAMTAMSNAHISRAPVLVISGRPPRPQLGLGAMQELPQADMVRPITRRVEVVWDRRQALPQFQQVVAAALGVDGPSGPAYIDFPTDLLDEPVAGNEWDERLLQPVSVESMAPSSTALEQAVSLLERSRRPLIISGREVLQAREELLRFVEASGAVHLETGESRGALPSEHEASVPAVRARAMREADLVITLDRRLDYQLGYGSRAVFADDAAFLRVGRHSDVLTDNRTPEVALKGDTASALDLISSQIGGLAVDKEWRNSLIDENRGRVQTVANSLGEAPAGADGHLHPNRIIDAVNTISADDAVIVADGGDILSFARVGLQTSTYLDCGALGCIGIGVPFANSASINFPGRQVIAVIGDGSFGFSAMEIHTAVRHGSRAVYIIANNGAWNIDRNDQLDRFDGHLVGVDIPGCRYDLVAQGLGAHGEYVEKAEDLGPAIRRALENAPAVVNVQVTRDALSPDSRNGLPAIPPYQAVKVWNDAEVARLEA
ncbi:thiamine pyrophosphate-binding protein [Rhodococcus koreensis]